MVIICYPMRNPFTGTMDCFYLEYSSGYPDRFELYDGDWEGGQVPYIGY